MGNDGKGKGDQAAHNHDDHGAFERALVDNFDIVGDLLHIRAI